MVDDETKPTFEVTGDELRQFIERVENLEAQKKDVADDIAAVYAEAKARGFDNPTIRRIIARRKKHSDDVAEEDAIMQTYLAALEA